MDGSLFVRNNKIQVWITNRLHYGYQIKDGVTDCIECEHAARNKRKFRVFRFVATLVDIHTNSASCSLEDVQAVHSCPN